jgi:hypothetical protein
MSIFSRILGSKKGDSPKGKGKGKGKNGTVDPSKPPPAPYKHVPVHAARDSMTLGPSDWSRPQSRPASTRSRSSQQIIRRSGMTRNNSGLSNVTTIHRANSGNEGGKTEWTSTQDQRSMRSRSYMRTQNQNQALMQLNGGANGSESFGNIGTAWSTPENGNGSGSGSGSGNGASIGPSPLKNKGKPLDRYCLSHLGSSTVTDLKKKYSLNTAPATPRLPPHHLVSLYLLPSPRLSINPPS